MTFRAGDKVFHKPTGETWILAVDQRGNDVYWCGWPEGYAYAKDCELKKSATDEDRLKMLRDWSEKRGNDARIRIAKYLLEN